jgi:ATP-binding cassette, subfamily B, bacterial PglK
MNHLEEKNKTINPIHQIVRLWKFFTPKRKRSFFYLIIFMIAASIAELVSIGSVLPFLAVLTNPESVASLPYVGDFFNFEDPDKLILTVTIIFASAVIISGFIRLLLLRRLTNLSFTTGSEIATLAYSKAIQRSYSDHVQSNSSELISTITNKTHSTIFTTLIPVLTIISSTFIISIILAALIFFNPLIAIVSISCISFIYIIISIFSRKKLIEGSQIIANKNDELVRVLQESLGGIREIIIDNSHNLYIDSYRKIDYDFRMAQSSRTIIGQSPRYWMEAIGMVLIAFFSYYMARTSDSFVSVVPILGTIALAAQRILPVMQLAYGAWANIQSGSYSMEDILDILNENNPNLPQQNSFKNFSFNHELVLDNVDFYHVNSDIPTLKNINLTVKKGQKIGIIGETGSGKSTLMDIMMGLLIPSSGSIVIDGIKINFNNLKKWQSKISHVSQAIFLVDATVNENIAFGVPKSKINQSLINQSAKTSHSLDFIKKLNNGLDSRVGERGTQLSGGQLQRIGIARALYKEKEVIFFDEATSALDLQTEEKIMNNIFELKKDLTMVMIAHRLETLKKCDFIVELKEGKINALKEYNDLIVKSK